MNYPTVAIIFPTLNGWDQTRECLDSIKQLTYPKNNLSVVIVDNGSINIKEQKANIKKSYPKMHITFILNNKNLGFAKAVNKGIKQTNASYYLITNNDIVFSKSYLSKLVSFLQSHPKTGIVGGKVFYKEPREKISFAGASFSFYTGLLKPSKYPNQYQETDWVSGCNMLIKQDVIKTIGLFDEGFFFYFEDLDFCLRANKAGYKVMYSPDAIMWHGEGTSIDRDSWQKKSEFYYQGKTRVLFKHATKTQLISCLLFQFFLGLPFHLIVLKHQNYTPAVKALLTSIKSHE